MTVWPSRLEVTSDIIHHSRMEKGCGIALEGDVKPASSALALWDVLWLGACPLTEVMADGARTRNIALSRGLDGTRDDSLCVVDQVVWDKVGRDFAGIPMMRSWLPRLRPRSPVEC